jgi:Collagen triple helix repeat (20 copies)
MGDTGPTGPQGPAGAQGAQGPGGPQGPKGMVWRGPWSALTAYLVDDTVQHQGSAYIAVLGSTGQAPPGASWDLVSQVGATGPQGPSGAQGATGPQGPAGPTGDTGSQGPQGPQGLAGSQGAQGPAGPEGPTGATGSRGPAVFSARANAYSTGTMFAPVTGIATVTAVEGDVETLSPNGSLTAQDLFVRATTAPGALASVTVTLREDGTDTAVACTITGLGVTTCTSVAASATIAAGSRLSLEITSTGVLTSLSLLVGWQVA